MEDRPYGPGADAERLADEQFGLAPLSGVAIVACLSEILRGIDHPIAEGACAEHKVGDPPYSAYGPALHDFEPEEHVAATVVLLCCLTRAQFYANKGSYEQPALFWSASMQEEIRKGLLKEQRDHLAERLPTVFARMPRLMRHAHERQQAFKKIMERHSLF